MKFRFHLLALLFLQIQTATAQTYIVPVHGETVRPFVPGWFSVLTVTNPHAEPVRLQIEDVYPMAGDLPCPKSRETHIPPERSIILYPSDLCGGFAPVQAFTFSTDKPVLPVLDVSFFPGCGGPQNIPIARTWFPEEQDVLIPRVNIDPGLNRANLLIVNPNESVLNVKYQKIGDATAPLHTVAVSPRSLLIHGISSTDFRCLTIGIPERPLPDPTCGIRLKADGQFFVGASLIRNDTNDAVYRSAVAR